MCDKIDRLFCSERLKGDILKKNISIFLAVVIMASSVVMAFAKPVLKGDTNCDGEITAIDGRNILLVVVGNKVITQEELVYYDVNNTGTVTAIDARRVLRTAAGLEDKIIIDEPTTEESATQSPEVEEISEEERMRRILEEEFIKLINEERTINGREKLAVHEILHKAARIRAKECLVKFDHTRPNGESYKTVLQGDLEYDWLHMSENIAWFYEVPYSETDWTKVLTDEDMKNFAEDFFIKFKNSSVHYENILYKEFTETGFGVEIVVTNKGTLKVACSQLFGTPA